MVEPVQITMHSSVWPKNTHPVQTHHSLLTRLSLRRYSESFGAWQGVVQQGRLSAALARKAGRRDTTALTRRTVRTWAMATTQKKTSFITSRIIGRRARRSVMFSAWGRWEIYLSLAEALAATQANWRRIFARIERAWDRSFIQQVVRQWKEMSDDAVQDKAEAAHLSVVAQLEETRSRLEQAHALVHSSANAQHRLAALDMLTERCTGKGVAALELPGVLPAGPGDRSPGGSGRREAGQRGWVSSDQLAESAARTGGPGHVEAYLARLEGERVRLEGERVRLEHALLTRVKDVARERAVGDKARTEAQALQHELTTLQRQLSDEQQLAALLRGDAHAASAQRDKVAQALRELQCAQEQLRADADAAKSQLVHSGHVDKTADSQQVVMQRAKLAAAYKRSENAEKMLAESQLCLDEAKKAVEQEKALLQDTLGQVRDLQHKLHKSDERLLETQQVLSRPCVHARTRAEARGARVLARARARARAHTHTHTHER